MTTKDLLGMSAAQLVMLCQDNQIELERLRKIEAAAKNLVAQKDWNKVEAYKQLEEALK